MKNASGRAAASSVPNSLGPLAALVVVTAAVLTPARPGRAETMPPSSGAERAAAYLQAGFSTASPHMSGAAVGGSLVLHVGRRLTLEGSGAYMDRGAGSSAASLSASVVVHLAPRQGKAVPYLVAGGGLYRASFDTRSTRFSGPAPSGEMMSGRYTHVMKPGPPGWDLGQLPAFYGDRVADLIAREGRSGARSFDDPALGLGAGMRIRLGRSWSLRQDARAQLVMRTGEVYAVGVFTLQLGHGF